MTAKELMKGLLDRMKTLYPETEYRYYSQGVIEGVKRPAFFPQLKPVDLEPCGRNARMNRMTLYITYFQEKTDMSDCLEKIDAIRDLFGLYVKIGDRAVDVTGYDWEYIGTDRNIPQISVDLEWMDRIIYEVSEPVMESAVINKELEE